MKSKSQKAETTRRIQYILIPFFLPLCLIALGILLLVNAGLVNKVFLTIGILCALVGLIEVVIYCSRRPYEVQNQHLYNGIGWLVAGGLLILIPLAVGTLIPVLIGLCILVGGISGISNTLAFRQGNESILIPMLFAGANCILGLVILIYVLFINSAAGWNVIGIFMIISGVLRIFNELFARMPAMPPTPANRSDKTVIDMDPKSKKPKG